MTRKACHCYLSGIVQGVGMRFNIKQIAEELGISGGYVRNLIDGRVEVYAEGEEERLQEFVKVMENDDVGVGKIDQVEKQIIEPRENLSKFEIRR